MNEELRWIDAAREGDQEAFTQLVRLYEKRVFALTARMCRNPADAEEAAQEAFLAAWQGLKFFRGDSSFSTWLYRLASNACVDLLRREGRRQSAAGPSLDDEDAGLELADPGPSPQLAAERTELRRQIEAGLAALPPEYRQVLILREIHQQTYEEIAGICQLDLGTVKSRISRGRKQLRKILLASGNFSESGTSKPAEKGGLHMKICTEYAALLDAFADGELTPEEMIRVQEHLDGCPACRAYVDDALTIRAAFPDAEDTEVPEGFAEAVSAAIRAGAAPRRRKTSPWAKPLLPLAACCAIVILLANGPASLHNRADNTAPAQFSEGAEVAMDTAAPEEEYALTEAESGSSSTEKQSAEDGIQSYADIPESVPDLSETPNEVPQNRERNFFNAQKEKGAFANANLDTAAVPPNREEGQASEPANVQEIPLQSVGDEGWVEYGNVVFAAVVCLSKDEAGGALAGYEGKPYSHPEDGVTGTGYAMEQADFERILEELGRPFQNPLDQNRTTELCCIVVTE